MRLTRFAIATAPALLVLLWSTGFIGARYGLPYIEPLTFLAVRMVFAVVMRPTRNDDSANTRLARRRAGSVRITANDRSETIRFGSGPDAYVNVKSASLSYNDHTDVMKDGPNKA